MLINNAAITTPVGPVWEVDAEAWWRCIESNLRGPFLCCRAVLPGMIARRRGRIINMASTAGMKVIRGYSGYSAGKAALLRFTENLAAEAKPYNVQVFAIELCLRLQRGSGVRRWGLEGRGRGYTRWESAGRAFMSLVLAGSPRPARSAANRSVP